MKDCIKQKKRDVTGLYISKAEIPEQGCRFKSSRVFQQALLALLLPILFPCCEKQAGKNTQAALIVHYYRYSGGFEGWNVWAWPEDPPGDGQGFAFDLKNVDADGFVSARIFFPLKNAKPVREFGMIIRKSENGNDWAQKDGQNDRFTGEKEIWLVQNDPAVYTEKPLIAGPPILFAAADTADTILLSLSKEPADYGVFAVYRNGQKISSVSQKYSDEEAKQENAQEASAGGKTENKGPFRALIRLHETIRDPAQLYTVQDESGIFSGCNVSMRGILDNYFYDADDLGLSYSPAESSFKVWAPTAIAVFVALYDDSGQYNSAGRVTVQETERLHRMDRDIETGLWSAMIEGDLSGQYYLYRVRFADGTETWAADPYAHAVSANGQRMAIINLADTNPPLWQPSGAQDKQKPPFTPGRWQDAVIYELHVRDFSIDSNSGMKHKGKFLAFTERGTHNAAGAASGLDHLAALGITHVHLLPVFDFASVNELTVDDPSSTEAKHNWGYDPMHYNVPEGSYSSDPQNPAARINEFKQMVQALHNAGIRVIMDVVYNHTFQTGNWPFDALVPGYYYRTSDSGDYTNGSGCGNEVASERPMVRKFIIDSCKYWAREYSIDGFRFDLMGLIDTPTMRELVSQLHSIDPTIIIYGEPWTAGSSGLSEELQTLKGSQKGLDFAVFNDWFRGTIKGASDDASRGFAAGQHSTEAQIVSGLSGAVNDFTSQANESINYVTAHDNLNLWDKFALSHGAKNLPQSPYAVLKGKKDLFEVNAVKSVLLANGIVFTSQGIPFFQAGDEFLRSKFADHNSYKSGDEINKIRWENAALYSQITDYYSGLLRLRAEHPAFRQSAKADIEQTMEILEQENSGVSFVLKNNAAGDAWHTIFVAYNGSRKQRKFKLPGSQIWYQTVDSRRAGTETLSEHSGTISLPPLSMAVLHD